MKNQNLSSISEIFGIIKSGNKKEGIDLLYKHHYNKMYGVAFSVVKNEQSSHEVVSSVCYKLMTLDVQKFPISGEVTWLYTVTKNQALDFLRREKWLTPIEGDLQLYADDVNISNFVDMDSYYSMIKGLNEEQRQIVTLKVIGGFTHKEIAQILQKPIGTVQWTYNVSIKKLRIALSSLLLSFVAFVTLFADKLVKKIQADNKKPTLEDWLGGNIDISFGASEPVIVGKLEEILKREETKIIIWGILAVVALTLLILLFINSHKVKVCAPKTQAKKLSSKKSFALGAVTSLVAIIVAGVILAECGLISIKTFEKPITADLTVTVLDKNSKLVVNGNIDVLFLGKKKEANEYVTDENGQFLIPNCEKNSIMVILKDNLSIGEFCFYTISDVDLRRGYALIILGED